MHKCVLFIFSLLGSFASPAAAQGPSDCGFGFDLDTQSSAFQSMVVDGEKKHGFWLSINRAPGDVRSLAKHIGRLQVCLMTPDGKPRSIQRGGRTIELKSPFLANCTAALLPNNRLLTNSHCFYNSELERAGFSIVREARIDFNYTSKDDTGAVRTYSVSPRELTVNKNLDALVLQVLDGDANADLGGHIPMKMMSEVEPFQALGMIHHPGAAPQQYSSGTCQVHRRQTEIPDARSPFRHTCESMGGSSGSLLFDSRTLAIVALHNQGGLQPTGDSFNSGHKIGMIEAALNLGFEEATQRREISQNALQALTDAFVIANPAERLTALEEVLRKFPATTTADKAQTAIAQLEAGLASRRQDDVARERLNRAQAASDVAGLKALLNEFQGTPLEFQIKLALLEAQSAKGGSATAAEEALTAALLLQDPNAQAHALRDVTLKHPNQLAARQAAIVLDRLISDAEILPEPKPNVSTSETSSKMVLLKPITKPVFDTMAARAGQNTTQAAVLERGYLRCGVNTGLRAFSQTDENGRWQGFYVDFCRAVAAAVLDDPEAVKFVPTSARNRFTTLASGDVDLLARNTTWTYSRDVDLEFDFPGVSFYDGQGFLVRQDLGVTEATELDGATVCIVVGSTIELHVAEYFHANDMSYEPFPYQNFSEGRQSYLSGDCDVFTTDRTALAIMRAGFERPSDHVILNELISLEPLGPVVRHGDQNWAHIVGGVLNALKLAETMEIKQDHVNNIVRVTARDGIGNYLESSVLGGRFLNLSDDMMLRAIKAVGNFGELYDRHFGSHTQIQLERYFQSAWNMGGFQYGEMGPSPTATIDESWPDSGYITLKDIRARGHLRCGVNESLPPFSYYNPSVSETRAGFGPELCGAVATAIFSDPTAYTQVIGNDESWPLLLATGEVDIVPAPVKMFGELGHQSHITYAAPWFFSSNGFVVSKELGVDNVNALSGAVVCAIAGAPDRAFTASWMNAMDFQIVEVENWETGFHSFAYSGGCDAFMNNTAQLASAMLLDDGILSTHRILPDATNPLRPIRPALPSGDNALVDLVNWVIYALITAEELGLTANNVESFATGTTNPEINRLLGYEGQFGAKLNLSADWAVQVIANIGNYGEIYDRVLGPETGLDWDRGMNRLWRDGGLHVSPPFR